MYVYSLCNPHAMCVIILVLMCISINILYSFPIMLSSCSVYVLCNPYLCIYVLSHHTREKSWTTCAHLIFTLSFFLQDFISPGHLLYLLETSNIIPVFITVTPTQPHQFYNVSKTHEVRVIPFCDINVITTVLI